MCYIWSMDTKTCLVCRQSFPATPEHFTRDKSRADGLHPYCKACRNKERRERRHADPEAERHNRERANAWYWANKERACASRKRAYSENREQAITASAEWRRANPERYRATQHECKLRHYRQNREAYAAYVRNRRARIRDAEGSHTAKDVRHLFREQRGRCLYCGCDLSDGYHVDHVIPISRGGSNDISNLALACRTCNCSKNNRPPNEWPQKPR